MSKNITVQYAENSKRTVITTFKGLKPVSKVITDKKTGQTTIEVYKEGRKEPLDTYLWDIVD
jgi:hypothetical protein